MECQGLVEASSGESGGATGPRTGPTPRKQRLSGGGVGSRARTPESGKQPDRCFRSVFVSWVVRG